MNFHLVFLFPLLFFAKFSSSSTCQNGVSIGSGCSCFSGFTGTSCDTSSNGTCPLPPAAPLATSSIGEWISGSQGVTNSIISFEITSPATFGRYFQAIQFSSSPNCSYPGPNFVKGFEVSNCTDTFTASIPFANIANDCNFAFSSDSSNDYYDGILNVQVQEPITTSAGYQFNRTIFSSLRLRLTLPTVLQLNVTSLSVYPIPIQPLDAGLTQQVYNQTTDIATIQLTTTFEGPFNLVTPSVLALANPFSYGFINPSPCQTYPGTPCVQQTTLILYNVTQVSCNLNGNYTLQWSYSCQAGFQYCPLNSSIHLVSVPFSVTSNDLCGKLEVVARLSGTLNSYSDSQFLTQATSFATGNVSYYLLTLTSDVSIQAIQFTDITVQDLLNGNLFQLYNGESNTPLGNLAVLFIPPQSSSTLSTTSFSFFPSSPLFSEDPSKTVGFTVFATVQVTYKTTFGSRKRDIVHESFKFSTTAMVLPDRRAVAAPPKSSSMQGESSLINNNLLVVALVAVLWVFRRKIRNLITSSKVLCF